MSTIEDGSTGTTAKVDTKRRLCAASVTTSARTVAAIDGDQFSIDSQIITLTSANESALLFIRNEETSAITWALTGLTITGAGSTGGTGDWLVSFNKNASIGTLVSAGTAVVPSNLNLGSTNPLAGTFLEGVEGSTITGWRLHRKPHRLPLWDNKKEGDDSSVF